MSAVTAEPPPVRLEAQRSQRLSATALSLRDTVASLAVEDFRIEDFRFERDCRAGRDLLFLLSNNDWARRTTEVVDVGRVRAVDAEIIVDIDLSYVTHAAFQPDGGLLWLPILALPAGRPVARPTGPTRERRRRRSRAESVIPDPITSLEVADATGARVTKVPQSEVHHWLAAVLAETLLPQVQTPDEPMHRAHGRDQVVLLAAAIRRMLQRTLAGTDQQSRSPARRTEREAPGAGGLRRFDGRVTAARAALAETFAHDLGLPRPGLASRVMEILDSLIGTVLVVVAIDRSARPTSFTVRLPSRRLVRPQSSILRLRPRARLQVDLLAATSHVDRLVRLNLPDGVTWVPPLDQSRPDVARIEVRPPRPFDQLRALVGQLDRFPDEPVSWVERRLAELAVDKVDAAVESLQYYRVADPSLWSAGLGPDPTELLLTRLVDLQGRLRVVAASGGMHAPAPADEHAAREPKRSLREYWRDGAWLPRHLERRLVANTASPDAVQLRASAIEDFTLRAEPIRARLDLDVAVEESTVLDTARDTNAINLLLLVVVTALLAWHGTGAGGSLQLDVLATVLTLFPAVQASRIARPDVTTLEGLLTQPGYWLSLSTAVPAILLAASLAVVSDRVAVWAAAAATLVQALLALLIRRRAAGRSPSSRPKRPGLSLATDHAPDHRGFEVLRSTWCRSLSAEALNLGHPAFAEVVLGPDGPGALGDLLEADPADLLALFRATAAGHAMTMLVSRDPLVHASPAGAGLFRPVPLELGAMVPTDPPEWIIEVLVGIPREAEQLLPMARHPLAELARAAKASNYRVLFLQFPSPPPRRGSHDLVWLRIRVGVPYRRRDTLGGLRRFLAAVHRLRDHGQVPDCDITVQIVPEMATLEATETAPEETFGGSSAPARLRPVTHREIDVAAPAVGEVWRPFAFCANGRAGLIADAVDGLAERRPELRIAGATSAFVHGLSMTFLLCRDPDPAEPPEGYLGRLVARDLSGTHRLAVPIDGRRLAADRVPGRTVDHTLDLTADPVSMVADRPAPLLRVQVRTADRPGALRDLLAWVRGTVEAQGLRLGIATGLLDVWSALVRVVDGRTLQGRVTVRLPDDDSAPQGWDSVDWSAGWRPDSVVVVDLVRVERDHPVAGHPAAGHLAAGHPAADTDLTPDAVHSTQTNPAG